MKETLLDKFAMAALQGLLSNPEFTISLEDAEKYGGCDQATAHYVYAQAAACLEARPINKLSETEQLRECLRWTLEYIDAIPEEAASRFPAMLGFDRDYVDSVLQGHPADDEQ